MAAEADAASRRGEKWMPLVDRPAVTGPAAPWRQAFLSADEHSSDKRGVSAAMTLFQVFRRPHAGRGQGRAPRSPHRLPPTWPPRGSEQAASS